MTSKHFVALSLVVGGLAAVGLAGTGCGNGDTASTGTTSGTGGTTGPTSSHSSTHASGTTTSVATSTSGTGGMMGGGNHSFDTANDIGVGAMATAGTLQDAVTADYYKFMGKKGDRMIITAAAQRLTGKKDLNDPTVTDTVVTIFDANKKAFAQDDDEFPRYSTDSQLFTELPADGEYYLTVEDCNSYAASHPGVGCAAAGMVKTFDYQIFAGKLKDTNAGTMQDGTTAKAVPITYTGVAMMTGLYNDVLIDGNFKSTTDKHVFTFTVPANLKVDPQARSRAYFWVQPFGVTDGDGTTSNVKVWVTDDMAGTHIVAEADQSNYMNGDTPTNGALQFSFPVDAPMLGKPFYLFVSSAAATSMPDSDYYFILHGVGSVDYGQAEAEGVAVKGANDTKAMAETIKAVGTNKNAFFVDAQIGAPGDVDWFTFSIPAMVGMPAAAPKSMALDCSAARDGSGLVGFTATLFQSDGTTALITLTETLPAKIDLSKGGDGKLMLPAGVAGTTAFIKVSATGQDMSAVPNTGNYYHCGAQFF